MHAQGSTYTQERLEKTLNFLGNEGQGRIVCGIAVLKECPITELDYKDQEKYFHYLFCF